MAESTDRLSMAYDAAVAYYDGRQTQAQIATRLGLSRPTVSRLLDEAREAGLVTITITPPGAVHLNGIAEDLAKTLGLTSVNIAPGSQNQSLGTGLLPAVTTLLQQLALHAGDVVVVASGRTVYELSLQDLPPLPGVILVPSVGGQADPEPWFQTNELVRTIASKTGARPSFIFAEAMPSPAIYDAMQTDPGYQRIQSLWERASAALVGVGAPPPVRHAITSGVPVEDSALSSAAGDVSLHFFDHDGHTLDYPGADRMVRIPLDTLRKIPHRIATAAGVDKTPSIIAAAKLGMFHHLVTDEPTARSLAASLGLREPQSTPESASAPAVASRTASA